MTQPMTAQELTLTLQRWFKHDSTGGILLVLMALLAMVLANSPIAHIYDGILSTPLQVQIGAFNIAKHLT